MEVSTTPRRTFHDCPPPSLLCRLTFGIFQPNEQPLLGLTILEMNERRCGVLRQIGYTRFHNRPILACDSPGRALGIFVNQALDFVTARSRHSGGVQVAFGDGHVEFVTDTINAQVWRLLGAMNDGYSVTIE